MCLFSGSSEYVWPELCGSLLQARFFPCTAHIHDPLQAYVQIHTNIVQLCGSKGHIIARDIVLKAHGALILLTCGFDQCLVGKLPGNTIYATLSSVIKER